MSEILVETICCFFIILSEERSWIENWIHFPRILEFYVVQESLGSCFYGEEVSITISVGEISKVGFELYYQLGCKRKNESILLAKAKTGMVCYDYRNKKVAIIPDELKKMLGGT